MPTEPVDPAAASAGTIAVEVVCAEPGRAWRVALVLPAMTTALAAAEASGLAARLPGGVIDPDGLAVFGRAVHAGATLRDGDRLELLRPLRADPRQQRRERAKRR